MEMANILVEAGIDVAFGQDMEFVIVRSGDVMKIYPAAMSIPAMIARLRSLPAPPTIEHRDIEGLPERDDTAAQ